MSSMDGLLSLWAAFFLMLAAMYFVVLIYLKIDEYWR